MKGRMTALACAVAMLASCIGGNLHTAKATQHYEGMSFTAMLAQDHMYDSVGRALEEKFPGINFEFMTARTGADTMLIQAACDDLPDIIVGSSGGMRYESGSLNPYLYDFNGTDIPGLFYKSYLDNYRMEDGSIHWLPGCAVLEGVLANLDLFEQYGVDVPTDYASFADACAKFNANGIRGYDTDWKYDYTDTYLLQGWNIAELQGVDGLRWRASMMAGENAPLDDKLGLNMFEHIQRVIRDTYVTADDLSRGYTINYGEWKSGKLAMMRYDTSFDSIKADCGFDNLILLPYFGETEKDNWYFSSPAYCVTLNAELAGDLREDAALDIIRTLFTQNVISDMAANAGGAIAYVKNANIELADGLENIQPYAKSNHIYMMMDSGNIYSASKLAVQSMISDGASPADALAMFNEEIMSAPDEQPIIAHIDNAYSWQPTYYGSESYYGSEAYSAIANTLRGINELDMLLVTADTFATSIYAGGYTEARLTDLLMSGGTYCYSCQNATGAYIRELTRELVEGMGKTDDPISFGTLPVSSGFEMQVSRGDDGGFHLNGITVNGKQLDDNETYSFGHIDLHADENIRAAYGDAAGEQLIVNEDEWMSDMDNLPDVYMHHKDKIVDQWISYFKNGGTLESPSAYMLR